MLPLPSPLPSLEGGREGKVVVVEPFFFGLVLEIEDSTLLFLKLRNSVLFWSFPFDLVSLTFLCYFFVLGGERHKICAKIPIYP